MKKTQWIDLFREIKKNLGRYLSLIFIVALGTAFFAGVRSAEPDMIASADKYYDESNLMDVRIIGTLGLTAQDVEAIGKTEGIAEAEGGYTTEVMSVDAQDKSIIKVMSPSQSMNQMTIWQGRMPEKENECFMDEGLMVRKGYEIGDTITLVDEDGAFPGDLKYDTYEIVGSGTWAWYLSWTRGSASIGDGSLDAFMVVAEEAFDLDYYTVIYAMVHGAADLNTFSDTYDEAVKLVTERIEEIAGERCDIRYSEVYEDAEKAIQDAKQEVSDGVQELKDAEQKLLDGEAAYEEGKTQYEDGLKAYNEGLRELEQGRQELTAAKKKLDDGYKEYEKGAADIASAEKTLQEFSQKLEDGYKELEDGKKQVQDAKDIIALAITKAEETEKKLEAEEADLAAAWSDYESELNSYNQQKKEQDALSSQINELEEKIANLEAEIAELEAKLNSSTGNSSNRNQLRRQINEKKSQLQEAEKQLTELQKEYDSAATDLEAMKSELDATKNDLDSRQEKFAEDKAALKDRWAKIESYQAEIKAGEQQVADGVKQLHENEAKYKAAQETLEEKKTELKNAKAELEKGEADYQSGQIELAAAEEELRVAKAELDSAAITLLEARQEIEDGWKEYKEIALEANKKLDEAREKIADGEAELIELEAGEWYVLGRDTVQNSVEYGMDAERIGAIGKVFPVIFFLVAALVSLTSMTRMIEEERTMIGTMKALGYSKYSIAGKYVVYAASATLVGGIVGVIVGSKLLPFVIMKAYGMLYDNIQYMLVPLHAGLCVTAIGLALLCTVGATILACYKELLSTPAALMRPPAPKQGKRVLLERIPMIWERLNFSMKSTVRNLVRYKKRLFMTVFGIGGCMAILLVSFGLSDSIAVISDRQYKDIWHYSASCGIDEKESIEEQKAQMEQIVNGSSDIQSAMLVRQVSLEMYTEQANKTAYLYVPEDSQAMKAYVDLHERISREGHELSDAGVILSEKLANTLGVKEGDSFTIKFDEKTHKDVQVDGIVENYLSHYVYMSSNLYERVQGEAPEYNQYVFKYTDSMQDESKIATYLLQHDIVNSVSLVTDLQEKVDNMLEALNLVVWVLIVAAGLLVFVVLYNLNNINISERRRELATLKVLGFYDNEVAMYVYRENMILTALGILAGVFMGIWLHQYLIVTLEVEIIMFGREIMGMSYIYSIVLTIIFAILVNTTMYYKLKQIDMIESLKSVE